MADAGLFKRLKRLFSTNVVIRDIGGNKLRVTDTERIQSYSDLNTNFLKSRGLAGFHSTVGRYGYNELATISMQRLVLFRDYDLMECISGDTKIPLPDGTCPTIKELSERTEPLYVFAYDNESKSVKLGNAHHIHSKGVKDTIKLIFDNGENLILTKDHPVLMKNGEYKLAGEISVNEFVISLLDKSTITTYAIIAIENYGKTEVFDMTVDKYYNFATENCFVHNCDPIISAYLDILSDEATAKDEFGDILTIKSDNDKIKSVLHNLFYDILNIEFNMWPWTRTLVKYGDHFLKLEISEKYGVVNVVPVSPYEMTREEGFDPQNPFRVKFKHEGLMSGQLEYDNYEIAHFRLLGDLNFVPYGKCLSQYTSIPTTYGPKLIKDINIGDIVYSWDAKIKKAVQAKVLDKVMSGRKKVYEIKTAHRKIYATLEHPFLTSNGKYKEVKDLTLNDYLVLPKIDSDKNDNDNDKNDNDISVSILADNPFLFMSPDGHLNKGKEIDMSIINDNTKEFIRFFGFMLGDGWTYGNTVNFSLGDRRDKSNKYVDFINKLKISNKIIHENTTRAECVVQSKHFKTLLEDGCGFITGTSKKVVPKWVWDLPIEYKRELLFGFTDADGCDIDENSFQLGTINETLLCDLRELAMQCGLSVTKVWKTTANTINDNVCTMYLFTYRLKSRDFIEASENHYIEKVRSITEHSYDDVYDIQVDNKLHNFIANGVVVHNSMIESARRVWKQLCITGDSKIQTPDGYTDIKDIKIGDTVISYDYETKQFIDTKVKNFLYNGKQVVYEICTSNRTIKATEDHPLMIFDGTYIQVSDLTTTDELICTDYNEIKLEKIIEIIKLDEQDVYDIEIDNKLHNFVANGIVSGNCLMEDAMLIHRIMRAPEKRVFKIDTGNIPVAETEQYIKSVVNKIKKVPYVDPRTGEYNLKYNMMNMTEDFFIPVRGGDSGTSIESLPGLEYNAIEDVEYLRNKMMAALKIPKAFLGYDEGIAGGKVLSAEDVRFAKTIERIQKIIVSELTKVAIIHLYTQGFEQEEVVNFELSLSSPSTIYEHEKVSLWQERISLIRDMQEVKLLSNEWIYKNIINLSSDEIQDEQVKIIDDLKNKFRQSQIENEGNDPNITNKTFGTPHDIVSLQKGLEGGDEKDIEFGKTNFKFNWDDSLNNDKKENITDDKNYDKDYNKEKREIPPTKYGQDNHVLGRDPHGKKEYHTSYRKDKRKQTDKWFEGLVKDYGNRKTPELIKESLKTSKFKLIEAENNSDANTYMDENIVLSESERD